MKDNNNISQELLETIENYLIGNLSGRDLEDFNRLLELDEDFKDQVEDVKTTLLGIEAQSLKEQLDDFHKEIPETEIQQELALKKSRFASYSRIAAAAAIIIAVGSIWFFIGSPNEKLYANYFKPDPGLPTTMSSTNNFDFYDAMVSYKHGDYQIAIDKWKVLNAQKPENDTLNYFLGVAHLANKNEAEAIPYLERSAAAEDNFVFLNDAYFYLGLAYIKEGQLELAKKNLSLSNIEEAKKLLREIDN